MSAREPRRLLLWVALISAATAVALHHKVAPHGKRLDVPSDTVITIARTHDGWLVDDGTRVYKARSVRVDAASDQ